MEYMTHSSTPEPGRSDALLDDILAEQDAERERRAQAIQEAIAANPGKEPFSIDALAPHYALPRDETGAVALDEATIGDMMYSYYVTHPGAQTLQDFGQQQTWLDRNDAG
jgi:hypothetical protein